MGDWGQAELHLRHPQQTMSVEPLAYIDAENCEGWVDDVVVEKIAEPEQVMAELTAKANPPTPNEATDDRPLVREARESGWRAGADEGGRRPGPGRYRHGPRPETRRTLPRGGRWWGGGVWRPHLASGLERFTEITAGIAPSRSSPSSWTP